MVLIEPKRSLQQLQGKPTPNVFENATTGGVNPWVPPVTQTTGIYFYFPLEALVDDDLDSFTNVAAPEYPFTSLFNPNVPAAVQVINPGFIDNGAHYTPGQFPSLARTLTLSGDGGDADTVNSLNLAARDFTIRFWIKNDNNVADSYFFYIANAENIGGSGNGLRIARLNAGFGLNYYNVRLQSSGFADLEVNSAVVPGATTWLNWHRVVIRFEAATGTLSIQINDDAVANTVSAGFAMASVSRCLQLFPYLGLSAFHGYTIDEIFLAPDILWSNADSTDDYGPGDPPATGGGSPTWPNIPGVSIQGEAGETILGEGGEFIIEE